MSYSVAIIGAGGIAVEHLEALEEIEQLKSISIADIQLHRAKELAAKFNLNAYADYKEMIETEKPDIVVIALPHFLHKEAAVWCANQGCHILLEKPMALSVAECDEIIEAVNRKNVKLLVGHSQHYKAENLKVLELMASGDLGELVMINDTRHTHYYRETRPDWFFEKAKAGGGILTNLGSHTIDKIQWYGGAKIIKVRAAISYYGTKGDIEGSGLVFLENSNGVPATLSQSGYLGAPKNETELIFTNGMIKLLTGEGLWISRGGVYTQLPVEATKPFVLQFKDLIESIETGNEPNCTLEYSRSIVAVIETIYRSHTESRELSVGYE
jgi:predicted dehydrogenase